MVPNIKAIENLRVKVKLISNYQEAKKSLEKASWIHIEYLEYQKVLQQLVDMKKKGEEEN